MGHTCRNRPRLQKSSWTDLNGLDLKKWVTLEKMGYVFKKWFTLEKLVRFNKIDHIWRNVCSRLKKISQTLRKHLEKWVTLVKISYV